VIGYRKKLVFQHLQTSFPEKSAEEIRQIAQDFYPLLADLLVETLKLPLLDNRANQASRTH